MKRNNFISCAIACAIIVTIFTCPTVSASTLRSSPTLSSYGVVVTKGEGSGQIVITYDVLSNSVADSLGVSAMKIYKSNGNYVTTVYASSFNGFKTSGTMRHRASYTYTGTSGTSYYAEVTVFATIDGVTDSRTITTNTVKAP